MVLSECFLYRLTCDKWVEKRKADEAGLVPHDEESGTERFDGLHHKGELLAGTP